MKNSYLVYYDSREEQARLLKLLEDYGYRNWDDLQPGEGPERYAINVKPNGPGFSYIMPMIGASAISSGARFYTVDELELLLQTGFQQDLPRILFHVPHDGQVFPGELMKSVCIPENEFFKYHQTMADLHVSKLIPAPFHYHNTAICFEVSRLLCDVERFIGPEEAMEKYGMGFCYSKAYDGKLIKTVTSELKEETLKYYRRHHERLNEAVRRSSDHTLLIDLHSFSTEIVPEDYLTDKALPDICIGTDEVFTPQCLAESAKRVFPGAGYRVAENYPYSGCMIPEAVLKCQERQRFSSIMIEVNKSVYLDEKETVVEENVDFIRRLLRKLILEYEKDCATGSKGDLNSSLA